mmetsp:Transcript_37262/g.78065  ORF Transcript_37262/g.78065 Transcript_37262/m.78065 type:complete len:847 (+) Transcript_37262:261-2801(+)
MQRWLVSILVSLAILTALSILTAHNIIIAPGENLNLRSSLSELELGYMVGSGIPVQRRDYGMRPGGDNDDNDDNDDSKGGDEDGEDRSPQTDNNIVSDAEKEEMGGEGEEEEIEGGGEEDDVNHDRRPRKNPKGKKWKGWRIKPHGDDKPNAAKSDNQSESNTKQRNLPNNIGDSEQWWRKSRMCFEVDYICHGQAKNDWFYYAPSNSKQRQNPFQPTMELKSAPAKYDGGKDRGEGRISINVASASKVKPINIDDGSNSKCHVSSTPTHIVLQSLFNDMIGEFYARTLLRLYHFMMDNSNQDANNNNKDYDGKHKKPWEEDIQFYVHIPYGNKKMLDGHKLLLSGMLSNPDSPSARSLIDLFVRKEGGEDGGGENGDVGGEESADCQCYEKMVFCGYDVYAHDSEVKSRDLEPAVDDDDDDDDDDAEGSDNASDEEAPSNPASSNYDTKYSLWSAGKLDVGTDLDSGSCGRAAGTKGIEYECQSWNGLRNFLSSNFIRHYPTLEVDLEKRRRELLMEKGAIDESYTGDTKEFTVIGFTQRTYRRAWLNLPSILELCNDEAVSLERAICVEINVENASTPFEQLLLHRSLDVMIGVHGAQLTQAILLPDHAHILELLPWITDYIRGKWVQTKNGPTPLGVIFHNTNLNHVGFSLDRDSVPLCEGVPETALQLCFMKKKRNFVWENRDFNVESKAMLQYIKDFVLFGREKERTCEELKGALDDRFVLYNVWCSKPSYWYPTLVEGERDCVHGTEYPIDHTADKSLTDKYLFDNKDKCCDAFPGACKNQRESDDTEQKKSAGNAIALFHNYHKLSPTAMAEGLVLAEGWRKKRKKQKENRRKKKLHHR